jgi:hypothetical protein
LLAEHVEACPRCGAAYTVAPDETTARARFAERIGVPPEQVELGSSTPLGDGRFLCVGWNPDERLSALQIANVVRKSKPLIQNHLREGRFPGAVKADETPGAASWQGWAVPRRGVRAYMFAGRKPYELSAEGKENRGRPPVKE